jgi:hypothetical protein
MARIIVASMAMSAAASELSLASSFDASNKTLPCGLCTQIKGQEINTLLNYILNVGVVGGCSKLCGALPQDKLKCELVCGAVGIKAFTYAIEKADLDPIYMCELAGSCEPPPDDAYLELLQVAAQPAEVAHGADIKLAVDLNVVNDTGVGEFFISVDGPGSATPLSQSFQLNKGIPHGEQMLSVTLTLQDGKDEQGFPTTFEAGIYNYTFHVCQGSCGSKHPHSKDFGSMTGTFELSGDLPPVTTPPPPSCMEAFDEDMCGEAVDFMGEPCKWCDDTFSCQESTIPCGFGAVV